MVRVRRPAVAGYFYESDGSKLREQIEWCIKHEHGPKTVVREPRPGYQGVPIVISPHAGYIYSGPIAAFSFSEIYRFHSPRTFIIAGPNHHGLGAPVAIMEEGVWETPLGGIEVDTEIAREIRKLCRELEVDWYALEREHSIEVQIPFIQYLFGSNVKIVPIALMIQSESVATCLGKAIAEVIRRHGFQNVVYVASSDWNHYEPHEVTVMKDMKAIEKVLSLDVKSFYDVIHRYDISVCGYGAVAAAIVAGKELGVKEVNLLKHATSGDTSGYYAETVGYAAIAMYI